MKGIAFAAEVPFSYVFLSNLAYEISTAACSGILIRDQFNQILHGRNLDFPFWKFYSKITAKIKVYRGEKHVATLDQFVGYIFGLTA